MQEFHKYQELGSIDNSAAEVNSSTACNSNPAGGFLFSPKSFGKNKGFS